MAKLIMRRKASDNVYLHKDFHNALNIGLEYVGKHFGKEAAKQYLRQFAKSFYSPLIRNMRRRGLSALKKHLKDIYTLEGGRFSIAGTRDELIFKTQFCPAVTHIRKLHAPLSPLFMETERTVYKAICEKTPFEYELVSYDPKTGRSVQRFYSASSRCASRSGLRRSSTWLHRRKK